MLWQSLRLYPRLSIIQLIKFYQRTYSRDHGIYKVLYPLGFCRFKPTCSEYAVQSLEKYGLIKGGFKAFWRIMRCTPWTKPKQDLP